MIDQLTVTVYTAYVLVYFSSQWIMYKMMIPQDDNGGENSVV